MVPRRKIRRTADRDSGEDHTVGYGRPPVHTQFKPGQSGNPAGRPKGVRNLMTDVKRTLQTPIKVKEGGRTRKRSTQEGALMVLREKALKGDARALDRLFELALRFNNDATDSGRFQPLAADDQAILDAYVAEASERTRKPTTTTLPRRSGRKFRRQTRSDKQGQQ